MFVNSAIVLGFLAPAVFGGSGNSGNRKCTDADIKNIQLGIKYLSASNDCIISTVSLARCQRYCGHKGGEVIDPKIIKCNKTNCTKLTEAVYGKIYEKDGSISPKFYEKKNTKDAGTAEKPVTE